MNKKRNFMNYQVFSGPSNLVSDTHPFHADLDLGPYAGFKISADQDQGFEIFADPDWNTGLDFLPNISVFT